MLFVPAEKPTMYFCGVSTASSSINKVFPLWAKRLGLGDCELRGMDFKLHDEPWRYRAAVEFIKRDAESLGALVTTHKMDLCAACRDLFDTLEPLSASIGEVSSLYKRGGTLHARAADPWTVGYSLDAFLPPEAWDGRAEALILGAGGSSVALSWHLCQLHGRRPRRLHVADKDAGRLEHLRKLHACWSPELPLQCHHVSSTAQADHLVSALPEGSLIVNATGLGKDAPGSPLSHAVQFPINGYVWEFNYRGDLVFLEQAKAQRIARGLRVEDGWIYFVHGWTRVISDVFDIEIPTQGSLFDELNQIAGSVR